MIAPIQKDSLHGDIDLLIKSDRPIAERVRKSLRLSARLQLRLGDRAIDVLVIDPSIKPGPVHRVARETEMLL